MTALMLTLLLTAALLLGLVVGAGGTLLLRRRKTVTKVVAEPDPLDEWTAAAIDQAAVRWVKANHLPDEAAGPVADKLRLLQRLSSERGWN